MLGFIFIPFNSLIGQPDANSVSNILKKIEKGKEITEKEKEILILDTLYGYPNQFFKVKNSLENWIARASSVQSDSAKAELRVEYKKLKDQLLSIESKVRSFQKKTFEIERGIYVVETWDVFKEENSSFIDDLRYLYGDVQSKNGKFKCFDLLKKTEDLITQL